MAFVQRSEFFTDIYRVYACRVEKEKKHNIILEPIA